MTDAENIAPVHFIPFTWNTYIWRHPQFNDETPREMERYLEFYRLTAHHACADEQGGFNALFLPPSIFPLYHRRGGSRTARGGSAEAHGLRDRAGA